jgi:hypothetical protein
MTSLGGKLTALAYQLTKRVNKAEDLTYLSTNINLGLYYKKHYGSIMHRFRSKLVFLSKLMTSNIKDTSLPQKFVLCRTSWVRNILLYRPLVSILKKIKLNYLSLKIFD